MKHALFVALLSLPAAIASGQDPYAVAPQAYQKQFENDSVRVTRVHYAPNEAIGEHEHPARPTIFIYLNDGGAVRFKHQHGESGDYAATRPATRAGAYRLAAGRSETHVVDVVSRGNAATQGGPIFLRVLGRFGSRQCQFFVCGC